MQVQSLWTIERENENTFILRYQTTCYGVFETALAALNHAATYTGN